MRGANRRKAGHVAAVVLVFAVAASGCTDEDDSEAAPPSGASSPVIGAAPATSEAAPAPSTDAFAPSPSPTLRPVPPEARELSEAGALAFLEWWVEMYNHVEATGETDLVFEHSEPGCTFCQNFVDRVEPVYESGGRIERHPPTTFDLLMPEALGENGFFIASAMANAGRATTFDQDGVVVRNAPPTDSLSIVVGSQWAGDQWLLTDIGSEDAVT